MERPLEAIEFAQERLDCDDTLLALDGITRYISSAHEAVENAKGHLGFTMGYRPTSPGPRPHPEAGGMDHQDWNVERLEYERYDQEDEIDEAETRLDRAEDQLDDLKYDRKRIIDGIPEVIGRYAAEERERLKALIEKKRAAMEAAKRHEAWMEGSEIEGALELDVAIRDLAQNPNLADVRGKTSASGWRFNGVPYHGRGRLMFERYNPVTVAGSDDDGGLEKELLTIGVSEGGVHVEYARASEIDMEAVKRYGNDVATVDKYKFEIKEGGVVAQQNHQTGKVSTWLPNHMDNGTINASLYRAGTPYAAQNVVMSTDDVAKIGGVIADVTAAMNELSGQKQ